MEYDPCVGLATDLLDHRAGIRPAFDARIEVSYTATVGGAGPYVFWDRMLYAAVIAFKGYSVPELQAMIVGNSTTDAVTNVAPYWRVALQPHWGPHYLMVGTFGMYGARRGGLSKPGSTTASAD